VPFEHGRRVFAAAPEPKLFIELQGGHNDGWFDRDPVSQAQVQAFLSGADVQKR
jgi:uncharacterized protein